MGSCSIRTEHVIRVNSKMEKCMEKATFCIKMAMRTKGTSSKARDGESATCRRVNTNISALSKRIKKKEKVH